MYLEIEDYYQTAHDLDLAYSQEHKDDPTKNPPQQLFAWLDLCLCSF